MNRTIISTIAHGLMAGVAFATEGDKGSEGPKPSMTVETKVGSDKTVSSTVGEDGKFASRKSGDGVGVDFNKDGSVTPVSNVAKVDDEGGEEDGAEKGTEEEAKPAATEGEEKPADADTEEAPEALPDFDPENTEVVAAYDDRFVTKDEAGDPVLNFENLGAEVYANSQKEDGKPVLNDGTYAWLKKSFGVTKERADKHIQGEIALKQQNEATFYTAVGGKETLDARLAWAKDNYTADQKAKFNAALKAGGEGAMEALELLEARTGKDPKFKLPTAAQGGAKEKEEKKPDLSAGIGLKRAVSPAKTATTASSGGPSVGAAVPFANNDEYRKALREAGNDAGAHALVSKRLAASPFWKPNQKKG